MSRWWSAAVHASFAYAAFAAGTSRVHLLQNSDSVLQAIISLLHWTPYFWGENRLGMLVALLAAPVTEPAANQIFQTVLTAWSGLLAAWLLVRLTEDPPESAIATAAAVPLLMLLVKPKAAFLMIVQFNYVPPVALLLGGWFMYVRTGLPKWARMAGLVAGLLLSFWINVANVVMAAVAAALWPGFTFRRRAEAVSVIVGANIAATWFSSFFEGQSFREVLPLSRWFPALMALLSDASVHVVHARAMAILLGTGALLLAMRRKWDPRLALAAGAGAQIVFVSLSEWVVRNGSDARYIVPPLFVLGLLAAGAIAYPLGRAAGRLLPARMAYVLAAMAVVAVATKAFGMPSMTRARSYLVEVTRPAAETFGRGECTHLIGNYWTVWMAVYHDMLTGRVPPRHGVTFRSDAIRHLWDRGEASRRTYCGACADGTVEYFRAMHRIPSLAPGSSDGAVCRWTSQ